MAYKTLPDIDVNEIIKPASKSDRSDRRTYLITGKTGVGKTFSFSTIPAKGLYLDFDGKAAYLQQPQFDDFIDIVNLKFDVNEHQSQQAKVEALYQLKTVKELSKKYSFLGIDGLTNLYALGCQASHDAGLCTTRFKMNFDKMSFVDDWIWKRLMRWGAYFKNVILYCHEDVRSDILGGYNILPLCRSALSLSMAKNFQEVWHARATGTEDDVEFSWSTKPEESCSNNTAIPNLPTRIPNNFSFVLETDWNKPGSLKDKITAWEKTSGKKITKFTP